MLFLPESPSPPQGFTPTPRLRRKVRETSEVHPSTSTTGHYEFHISNRILFPITKKSLLFINFVHLEKTSESEDEKTEDEKTISSEQKSEATSSPQETMSFTQLDKLPVHFFTQRNEARFC